jgi:meso-butanediol dehydrogenase/(S,S)-butanediol dehydrogenase/diacetyl reductase
MRFDGKVALISGAGSGIGRATAIGFAARGAKVAVADLDGTKAAAVAAEIASSGGTAKAITADAGTAAGVEAMVAGAVAAFGGLDILHNNAFGQPTLPPGQSRLAFTGDVDDKVWTHTIDLGLTGVFRATKRAIPELLKRGGGAIVNTASISGLFADFAIAAYNAAKAGVINLTRVTAIEYASRGIRVNCVCPGAIDTPLLRPSLSLPGFAEGTLAAIPMRRLGRPEEMANVVLFLASDLASYVTGAAIVADGGLTAQTGLPTRIPLP